MTDLLTAAPLDLDEGVTFPLVEGRRSVDLTSQAVIADAVRGLDPALADRALAGRDWARSYPQVFRDMTALAVTAPQGAREISRAGLAAVRERFVVRRAGVDTPLVEAMSRSLGGRVDGRLPVAAPAVHTVVVQGSGVQGSGALHAGLSVPYRDRRLTGSALTAQLDAWVAAGVTEPSFAQAVQAVADHPQWLDLRGTTVVVLGAGAQLGPVASLLAWGAHVVAVDLPRYDIWQRLLATARQSPGRLSVPVTRWLPSSVSDDDLAAAAGLDVVTQAPELLAWLAELDGPFTLGSYVYADGVTHLRASVAVDALTEALLALRDDVSLAFLVTPTDVFPVPEEVVADSRSRTLPPGLLGRLTRAVPSYPGTLTAPDGSRLGLADGLLTQQGPSYALAKRIQRWRALHERLAGRLVSINVAPASRTGSVLRNRTLAAAYGGAERFGVEIFDPVTASTLMAALLVHDLRNPAAAANPATELRHPLELFWQGANHGGLWRAPYTPRSVLGVAVVLGLVGHDA